MFESLSLGLYEPNIELPFCDVYGSPAVLEMNLTLSRGVRQHLHFKASHGYGKFEEYPTMSFLFLIHILDIILSLNTVYQTNNDTIINLNSPQGGR